MKVFVVIPTIRSLDFLHEWEDEFISCHAIVVEDHETKKIHVPEKKFRSVRHVSWGDIRKDFKNNEWIFSRQNAGIRSYGFWKAYALGADAIITIDDDCYPAETGFVGKHINNLQARAPKNWFTTFPHPDYMYTRGFPYSVRNKSQVVISHGLWSNKMDMDAQTQVKLGDINIAAYPNIRNFVPAGYYFPLSSMNLAFRREVTPLMYFPLMGKDPGGKVWGYDRYDDIWAGIMAKKIIDHLGLTTVNGSPFVEHRKASDPKLNILKEQTGLKANEWFWKAVDRVKLTETTPKSCYKQLSDTIRFPKTRYFQKLVEAMNIWIQLF